MSAIVVIGGGEHARVVMDTAIASGRSVAGYSANTPSRELKERFGATWLGDDLTCSRLAAEKEFEFVLGVGAVGVSDRRQTALRPYLDAKVRFTSLVHPRATIAASVSLKNGAVIMAAAVINTGAEIGEHTVINTGAIIEHDCVIESFVMIGPAAALGGGVRVGYGSYVGLGSAIRDHVQIGRNSLVAMGAVVTQNVDDGSRVQGVPARRRT